MENMILIMVDELGDEVEVARFTVGDELDEDYIELWKDRKIAQGFKDYPEARDFYIEDRRSWNSVIHQMMRDDFGEYDPCEDEEEPEWD